MASPAHHRPSGYASAARAISVGIPSSVSIPDRQDIYSYRLSKLGDRREGCCVRPNKYLCYRLVNKQEYGMVNTTMNYSSLFVRPSFVVGAEKDLELSSDEIRQRVAKPPPIIYALVSTTTLMRTTLKGHGLTCLLHHIPSS